MLETNTIYNEDCINGMRLRGGYYDLILTDPPYNMSQKNNFHTMGRAGIDFGEWDKGFDLTGWIAVAVERLRKGGESVNNYTPEQLAKILEVQGYGV